MDNLKSQLIAYAQNPEYAEYNYNLAITYDSLGQTAAAISFFLRAAERTVNKNLSYECLLRIGLCFERQGNRNNTVRGAYEHAVCLLPKRPEAYFLLSRFYERTSDHVHGYMFAQLGLEFADDNQVPLKSCVEYPGKYGFIFEKMVCAWWWGKPRECRDLLQILKNEYGNVMDEGHRNATQSNLTRLGAGSEAEVMRYYWDHQYPQLRYKFADAEKIQRNWSGVLQDMFVLSMRDGKRNGTYLEIGAGSPYLGNNTKLLEEQYGWTGVGIEWDEKLATPYKKDRKNPVLQVDATKQNYSEILSGIAAGGVVDYLQLDCEPSKTTYDILKMIPFDQFKFAVITYEHDHYVDMTGLYRRASREYLNSKGYVMVANDISSDGKSTFEDWWAHPALINPKILKIMTNITGEPQDAARYMLSVVPKNE
jgi:tetratricopeptide (TPR) repeat protein